MNKKDFAREIIENAKFNRYFEKVCNRLLKDKSFYRFQTRSDQKTLFALFHQAKFGDVKVSQFFDRSDARKMLALRNQDAWYRLRGMSFKEAKKRYIELVEELDKRRNRQTRYGAVGRDEGYYF